MQDSPAGELNLYFRILHRRIHLAIAEWLWQLMKPALWEHDKWISYTIEDFDDRLTSAERDIVDLEFTVNNPEEE